MKRTYGGSETFHDTQHLDVEVDSEGKVVAVWFRCMLLPFEEHRVGEIRADSLQQQPATVKLLAVEIE